MVYQLSNAHLITNYHTFAYLEKLANNSRTPITLTAKSQLMTFHQVLRNPENKFRIRTEGHSISIFHADIDFMYHVAANDLSAYAHNLQLLSTVTSAEQLAALENNQIIVRKSPDYAWRVYVRDGFYRNFTERQALANYLENLQDQVKVSKNFIRELKGVTKYIKGNYFHVKDPRLVDMIHLIIPNFVRSVQQLVVKST